MHRFRIKRIIRSSPTGLKESNAAWYVPQKRVLFFWTDIGSSLCSFQQAKNIIDSIMGNGFGVNDVLYYERPNNMGKNEN